MKSKYTVIFFLLFLGGIIFAKNDGKKVAEFEGGFITENELNEKSHASLIEVKQNEYKVKTESLIDLIIEKLLQKESKQLNISVKQLKKNILEKKFRGVDEKKAREYFENNRDQISGEFSDIKFGLMEYINKREKDQVLQNYYREILQKYKVKLTMDPPDLTKKGFSSEQMLRNTEDDPKWGNPKAKVVVVEFSDLECPYCKKMQGVIAQLQKEYSGKIYYIFRDFPLGFHFKAKQAHIANNCALEQNKYFEFQKEAFEISPELTFDNLRKVANKVGMKLTQYDACMKNNWGRYNDEIDQDLEDAASLNVQGTPALFINGIPLGGYVEYEELKERIDAALNQK